MPQSNLRIFVASPRDVADAREVLDEVVDELRDIWGPRGGI